MYYISKITLGVFAQILFKVRIFDVGKKPRPPYIIASNHASYLDPPLIGLVTRWDRVAYIAKSELFHFPILGAWCRSVGCIETKRGSGAAGSIKEALNFLKKGYSIAIFPEGTRSKNGNLQEAKRGVGFLIAKSRVPVVPVYVHGTGEALSKAGKIRIGSEVSIRVGDPLAFDELMAGASDKKDYGNAVSVVMDRIAKLRELTERENMSSRDLER